MHDETRAHVVDALYAAMTTMDPVFVGSLRGVRVTESERAAAEQLVLERLDRVG